MSDLGVQLTFDDSDTSVAFSRELAVANVGLDFRVAMFDPKLNMDTEMLILVLKFGGAAMGAVAGFLALSQQILKIIKKPSVRIEIEGKSIELSAKASEKDIKALVNVLVRSEK